MVRILYILILLVLFSCENSVNKEKIDYYKKDYKTKNEQNPTMFYITKLDSLNNMYLIYAIKGKSYYKIVSEKSLRTDSNCNKIQLYKNYSLEVTSIVPDTSKISLHLDGVLYKGTEVEFEKDSIWDLYKSPNLNGLCFKESL